MRHVPVLTIIVISNSNQFFVLSAISYQPLYFASKNQMGQFLAIGLTYQVFASPERTYNDTVSLEEVREEMERSLLYDMNLYQGEENDDKKSFVFTLKGEPFKEGLIPFLEAFYPKIYRSSSESDCSEVIEKLRNTPFEQWIEFARDKESYAFQMDDYAGPQYIEIQKSFRPSVRLQYKCLMLYVGDGKIITEGISDFTRFFKLCFHETFPEHPIAKAVNIYVTG